MNWGRYSRCIIVIILLIIIISFLIIYQFLFNTPTTSISQINQTTINLYYTKGMIEYVFPLIYVITGILTTFLINEIKSLSDEDKVISVVVANLKSNLIILKYNTKRVELELRTHETTTIPLKLFKSDFWGLLNYNLPRSIDEKLFFKIRNAAIIMDSINEINQIKESHKAVSKTVRDPKFLSYNRILRKDITKLQILLEEIISSFDN